MDGELTKVEVRIIDPETGAILGEASAVIGLRKDLLTSSFAATAQDWFSTTCSAVGTMAYREAFPRGGREAKG
jgi:hypothetical protein